MQPALAWLLAGLLLVVVELMTGTFYLLILGIAAGIGSLVAFLGLSLWIQAVVAAIAAVGGAGLLHRYHRAPNPTAPKDIHNHVRHTLPIQNGVSQPQSPARRRYRR